MPKIIMIPRDCQATSPFGKRQSQGTNKLQSFSAAAFRYTFGFSKYGYAEGGRTLFTIRKPETNLIFEGFIEYRILSPRTPVLRYGDLTELLLR